MPKIDKYAKLGIDKDIVDYFYNNTENQTSIIAKHFGISIGYASKIIENSLSKKKRYLVNCW